MDVVAALVEMDSDLVSALIVIGALVAVVGGLLIAKAAMHGTFRDR